MLSLWFCGEEAGQPPKKKKAAERDQRNWTYSALDGPEGKHVLGSVAAVSTPGLVARVVSLLQDELLSLELGVLETHPAAVERRGAGTRGGGDGERGTRIEMLMLNELTCRIARNG